MGISHRRWRAFSLLSLLTTASTLYVNPGSDCAALCLGGTNENAGSTESSIGRSDIVCRDNEYNSEAEGIRYRNCVECLRESRDVHGDDSDLQWMLYNMRFALDTCLWNNDTAIHSPCMINFACEPLAEAVGTGLSTPGEQHFDYCTADGNVFSSNSHWSCVSCLQNSAIQTYYLSNFLQVLKAGCEQEPELGGLIELGDGEIFAQELLNTTITNTTLPGEGGAGSDTMTTGTIVGIAVGGGLFLLGAIALIVVYCRRRKKRQADDADPDQTPPPDRSNESSFAATKHSPRGDFSDPKNSPSIRSSEYELKEAQRYASHADFYEKMEESGSGNQRNAAHYNFDPRRHQHGPGSALPSHPAYNPRFMTRDPAKSSPLRPKNHQKSYAPDSYAMQMYLHAAEDHLAATGSRSQTPTGRASPQGSTGGASAEVSSTRDQGSAAAAALPEGIPPPPPGPPPSDNANNTSRTSSSGLLPSIPRIRLPKTQEATATHNTRQEDGEQGNSGALNISEPMSQHETRFPDRPIGGAPALSTRTELSFNRVDKGDMDPPNTGRSMIYN
ncbi:hypothetical protein SODALDRAFT_332634 [Sodiomyces alkalinus F11]|uniref:LPXTG-domain-containing protein n=1 Tax=Sodiomyces alkalinus (strain CBS 110278 / VKM F-3762 / F11) TaxID=1314773 RepID=A0A3N2PXF0_SODAK|nr:hypothetical protein SODALDRAFT_332634 [Sodiomyces alkalinus F11]ROT39210.1 hypothetical protein SODALDRAFT_332634 [Sodiomyces alkalinus F11]